MAVTTSNTLKLSDVCLEIYGSSSTSGRSLMQCHTDATGSFNGTYAVSGDTLLDFRGYTHTVADTQPPTPPSLTVGAVTETSIALSWSASSDNVGIANYEVWYRPDNNANYAKFATLSGGTTSDTVTGLSSGTLYWFFIRALDAAGNYTDSKSASGTTSSSTTAVSLASGSTSSAACGNLPFTRYIDTSDFISATKLWTNSAGTTFASAGWYSNGSQVRYWAGTAFSGNAQLCGL